MPEARETVLEIDLGALAHNFRHIRSKIGSDVKFMAVIKAFAYGNDLVEIAKKLENLGADYLAVAYTSEGVWLREGGIELPILVLHPQPVHFPSIINFCLEPNLYGERVLSDFIATAEKMNLKEYPIHLKFNTGMNRLGFTEKNFNQIPELLNKTEAVKVASAFSHLAASEDWREREFTLGQITRFQGLAEKLLEQLKYRPLFHICNSSAIFNYPEAAFDMVRCGLGLYGFANDPALDEKLQPVGTLKTVISQIQEIDPGESVGYGRAFKAEKPARIATLALGHADGLKRIFGKGKGKVLVNGKLAPIAGNVCMDISMIDVTDFSCKEGDQVIIFGGPLHPREFAESGGTITYELITGISQRVKRLIIPENE